MRSVPINTTVAHLRIHSVRPRIQLYSLTGLAVEGKRPLKTRMTMEPVFYGPHGPEISRLDRVVLQMKVFVHQHLHEPGCFESACAGPFSAKSEGTSAV